MRAAGLDKEHACTRRQPEVVISTRDGSALWQHELDPEGRACAHRAVTTDPGSHPDGELPTDGEPEAVSAMTPCRGAINLDKGFEQLGLRRRADAHARVAHFQTEPQHVVRLLER